MGAAGPFHCSFVVTNLRTGAACGTAYQSQSRLQLTFLDFSACFCVLHVGGPFVGAAGAFYYSFAVTNLRTGAACGTACQSAACCVAGRAAAKIHIIIYNYANAYLDMYC